MQLGYVIRRFAHYMRTSPHRGRARLMITLAEHENSPLTINQLYSELEGSEIQGCALHIILSSPAGQFFCDSEDNTVKLTPAGREWIKSQLLDI